MTAEPYRILRHPRYAGILLYNLGLLFLSGLALLLTGLEKTFFFCYKFH